MKEDQDHTEDETAARVEGLPQRFVARRRVRALRDLDEVGRGERGGFPVISNRARGRTIGGALRADHVIDREAGPDFDAWAGGSVDAAFEDATPAAGRL